MKTVEDIKAAVAALTRRLDEIDAMQFGEAKAGVIRETADEIGKLWNRITQIRKDEMFRIRDAEQLSLAALADRVGISKARADQLIKAREKEDRNV